jgi:hypothetical protein
VNGKPGDHPLNDIVDYKLPVFSLEIDSLVLRLSKLVPRYRLREMFDWFAPPDLHEFERQLRAKVQALEAEARERGWEPADNGF